MVVCTLSAVSLVPYTGASNQGGPRSQSRVLHVSIQSLASSGSVHMITMFMASTSMLVNSSVLGRKHNFWHTIDLNDKAITAWIHSSVECDLR